MFTASPAASDAGEAITGTYPPPQRSRTSDASSDATFAVRDGAPCASGIRSPVTMPLSAPEIPTAFTPARSSRRTRRLFASPQRIISTTSISSSEVMRIPS